MKAEFDNQLKSRDDKIAALEKESDMREGKLYVIDRPDKKIDDGEQYSKRVCFKSTTYPSQLEMRRKIVLKRFAK